MKRPLHPGRCPWRKVSRPVPRGRYVVGMVVANRQGPAPPMLGELRHGPWPVQQHKPGQPPTNAGYRAPWERRLLARLLIRARGCCPPQHSAPRLLILVWACVPGAASTTGRLPVVSPGLRPSPASPSSAYGSHPLAWLRHGGSRLRVLPFGCGWQRRRALPDSTPRCCQLLCRLAPPRYDQ